VGAETVALGSTERSRAEVILETQSTRVLAGRPVKGEVVTNTKETLQIKSARLTLACVEETHIRTRIPFIARDREQKNSSPPRRFLGAYEKSVIMERSLTLRGEDTISPPGARFPFELKIPTDALPSYSGRSATVGWRLEAKVVPALEPEIVAETEVTVLPMAQRESRPVVAANKQGAPVGLELEVFRDIVEPGDEVEGRLTVTRLKTKPQRILVKLIAHEFAKARQTVGYQIDTSDMVLTVTGPFDRGQLQEGRSQCFTLQVPEGTVTYVGKNSSSRLLVKATAALRFRRDISSTAQVHVGTLAQSLAGGSRQEH